MGPIKEGEINSESEDASERDVRIQIGIKGKKKNRKASEGINKNESEDDDDERSPKKVISSKNKKYRKPEEELPNNSSKWTSKFRKRFVFLIGSIILLLLLLVLVLFMIFYFQLKNKYEDLEKDYKDLQNEFYKLEEKFEGLLKEHEEQVSYYKSIIQQFKLDKIFYYEALKNIKVEKRETMNLNELWDTKNILNQEKNIFEQIIKENQIFIKSFKMKYVELKAVNTYLSNQLSLYRATSKTTIIYPKNTLLDLLNRNTIYYDNKMDTLNYKFGDSIKSHKTGIILDENSSRYLSRGVSEYREIVAKEVAKGRSLDGFYSITNEGIFLWEYNSARNIFESTNITSDDGKVDHWKGTMMEGIYIVGGNHDDDVKLYNMKQTTPKQIILLASVSEEGHVFSCFPQGYHSAICLTSKSLARKYKYRGTYTGEHFYSASLPEFFLSGIETIDKYIILGTNNGKLYILDGEGNYISMKDYNSNAVVFEMAEVNRNRLLTADGSDGCYLHNIDDVHNILSTLILWEELTEYKTILKLGSKEGYFAIGGKRNNKGFVDIYNLEEVERINQEDIEGDGCIITAIRELKSRIIVFGGELNCTSICLWNYAAQPTLNAYCWSESIPVIINDLLPLP